MPEPDRMASGPREHDMPRVSADVRTSRVRVYLITRRV